MTAVKYVIAEDEYVHRQGLAKLIELNRTNAEIHLASNGQQALDLVREHRADVLFTDIRMPKLDGLELLKLVNELESAPLTVILSGYDLFEYARQALIYHVMDYLLKPIDKSQVLQILNRIDLELAKRRASQPQTGDEAGDNSAGTTEGTDNELFLSCLAYIKEHMSDETISLQTLADHYHFSRNYFSSWFKNHAGLNFRNYLTQVRMTAAAKLLGSDHKVYEVALAVGFHDVKYFNRVFKEYYKLTPEAYRRKNMGGY
ncbi:response regulator transcription factor [Paenibacillus albus]|uniref:Response regulator n=1 Tax=Paenibacillus albus TaxID=2495582 RepID=A0A3Q8X8Y4_9BACL|nr:response regulator [Paenibacillus albus]AZN43122.1 response regulator [Paenibacillus albus]